MRTLRRRLTYANVCATLALLLAFTGIGYAKLTLPKNIIGTNQVKNNSLRSGDIRNNDVKSADIKNSSVLGVDIGTNQVQGKHVNESSLGQVPAAARAVETDGFVRSDLKLAATTGADQAAARAAAPLTTLVEAGAITLKARCFQALDTSTVVGEVIVETAVPLAGDVIGGSYSGGADAGGWLDATDSEANRIVMSENFTTDNDAIAFRGTAKFHSPTGDRMDSELDLILKRGTLYAAAGDPFGSIEDGCSFGALTLARSAS